MRDVSIKINGSERSKNEIIYNNVVSAMENDKFSKDEQINYLKEKIANVENNTRTKLVIALILVIGVALLFFGVYLLYLDSYFLGILLVTAGFCLSVTKLIIIIYKQSNSSNKYSEIERYRSILNNKLK